MAESKDTVKSEDLQLRQKLIAAYAAGLVDGEGYIGIIKTHNPSRDSLGVACLRTTFTLRLEIQMTHKSTIDWFQKTFKSRPVTKILKDNGNHGYRTGAVANKALTIIKFIYPYMRTKKIQAALAIEFQERRAKNHLRLVRDQDREMVIRNKYYLSIRKLNTMKGVGVKHEKMGLHIHPFTRMRFSK